MVDKQRIIHLYHTCSYSKRKIARELEISRKTVHKVIVEYESALLSMEKNIAHEQLLPVPFAKSSTPKQDMFIPQIKQRPSRWIRRRLRPASTGWVASKWLITK
jgi:DNA-binding XRE family transcriptional regulator